ncbi:MAG TPA: hypothetical protein VGH20_11575 [Myxococcales bacterium]|jgi:hypothetical protein
MRGRLLALGSAGSRAVMALCSLSLAAVCSLALVFACSNAPQANRAIQDAAKAQAELKRQLGVNSTLMYGYMQGADGGTHFDVQVRYSQKPEGDPAQVQEKTEAIVKQSFRDPVSSVIVRY